MNRVLEAKSSCKGIFIFKIWVYLRIYHRMNETFFISMSLFWCEVAMTQQCCFSFASSRFLIYFETQQKNKGFSIQSQEKIHFSFILSKRGTFGEGSNEVNLKFEFGFFIITPNRKFHPGLNCPFVNLF